MSTQSSTAVLKANYFYFSQYHPDFHTMDCLVETQLYPCGQGVKNPYGKPFVHACCLGSLIGGCPPSPQHESKIPKFEVLNPDSQTNFILCNVFDTCIFETRTSVFSHILKGHFLNFLHSTCD
jgi:hypothetical protein